MGKSGRKPTDWFDSNEDFGILDEEVVPDAERGAAVRRSWSTARLAAVAILSASVLMTVAYPLNQWREKGQENAAMRQSNIDTRAHIRQMEAQLRNWRNPEYVAQQARERLHYTKPGETVYIVVPDSASTAGKVPPSPKPSKPARKASGATGRSQRTAQSSASPVPSASASN